MSWNKEKKVFEPTKCLEDIEPNLCCYVNPHHKCRHCGWSLCVTCFTELGPYQARDLIVAPCKRCGL